MKMECQGCTKRTVEPNCHNVETCEFWARHMAEREKKYAERELEQLSAAPRSKYRKAGNKPGGDYIRGDHRPRRSKGGMA